MNHNNSFNHDRDTLHSELKSLPPMLENSEEHWQKIEQRLTEKNTIMSRFNILKLGLGATLMLAIISISVIGVGVATQKFNLSLNDGSYNIAIRDINDRASRKPLDFEDIHTFKEQLDPGTVLRIRETEDELYGSATIFTGTQVFGDFEEFSVKLNEAMPFLYDLDGHFTMKEAYIHLGLIGRDKLKGSIVRDIYEINGIKVEEIDPDYTVPIAISINYEDKEKNKVEINSRFTTGSMSTEKRYTQRYLDIHNSITSKVYINGEEALYYESGTKNTLLWYTLGTRGSVIEHILEDFSKQLSMDDIISIAEKIQ